MDYEGDHKYLAIDQLTDLLGWVHNLFGSTKRFYYTIAVRSTYDILHVERDDGYYIQQILLLYEKYSNFHIILVAGNRKYVDLLNQKMHMKERFQTWIQELQKRDLEKEIFIGADNIFKLARSLLSSYENTKAILLKSSNLNDQMKLFNVTLQDRLGVYSLLIESDEKAVALEYVRGYLQRRGIAEQHYKEKVLDYAIQHDDYFNTDLEQKYNFMFLFAIES